MSSWYVGSQCDHGILEALFKKTNAEFNGGQEKKSIFCMRIESKSPGHR